MTKTAKTTAEVIAESHAYARVVAFTASHLAELTFKYDFDDATKRVYCADFAQEFCDSHEIACDARTAFHIARAALLQYREQASETDAERDAARDEERAYVARKSEETDSTSETYADYCARVASYTFSDEEIARETARRVSADTYDAACYASLDDTQQAQQSRATLAARKIEDERDAAREEQERAKSYADAVHTHVSREDETTRINASADDEETYEEYSEIEETEATDAASVTDVLAFDDAARFMTVCDRMSVSLASSLASAEKIALAKSADSHKAYVFVFDYDADEASENRIVAIYQNARLSRIQREM